MDPRVTIQIVGWNSEAALPLVVRGLRNVQPHEAVIRYLDNGSSDNSVRVMREGLPQAEVVELKENRGFAGAHSEGFRRCRTPMVLVLNPDVEIKWDGVVQLMKIFDDPNVGAAQGKLWRVGREKIIDSAGIDKTLSLNGRERGANEEDRGQYDAPAQVWAVTGACGLYRMEALKAVGTFDEDFFAYKEDVDLGWRLNKAGWKVVYEPVLTGYHARTMKKQGVFGWRMDSQFISKRMQERRTRYSFRNWAWMVVKNITLGEVLKHGVFVLWRLLVFLGLSFLYPKFFQVWGEVIRGFPRMLRKRV